VLREPLALDDLASELRRSRSDAILGLPNPALDDVRVRIVEIVNAQRLPSVFGLTYWTDAGGLISYSADLYAVQRRSAMFVDKILKGADPATLPIEQPTKVELAINLRTAKTHSGGRRTPLDGSDDIPLAVCMACCNPLD